MTLYEQKFRDILAEILQLDQAELDFGIYRIMNQKRKDIEAFLNNRLVPEVTKILKAQTAAGTDISAMENEVFSHLAKFFSRYYEGGDFISKRRYKDDAYAIPYSGEEVKLYWAMPTSITSRLLSISRITRSCCRPAVVRYTLFFVMRIQSRTTTRLPTIWSAVSNFVKRTVSQRKMVS